MSPEVQYNGLVLASDPTKPIYTFGVVKPHRFSKWPQIVDDIEYFSRHHHNTPLVMVQGKEYRITPEEAAEHYHAHREKPFFPQLIRTITEGPVYGFVLAGNDAIPNFRRVVGPTDPNSWTPFTIRHRYGEVEKGKEFNAMHASDSPESFVREVELHFERNELDEFLWAWIDHYKAYLDSLKMG